MDSLAVRDPESAEGILGNKLLTAFGVSLLVTVIVITGMLLFWLIIRLCHLALASARVQQPVPFYVIYHADGEDVDDGFQDGSTDALSEQE